MRPSRLRRRERGPGVAGQLPEQLGLAAGPQLGELAERALRDAGQHRVERHALAVGLERPGDRAELVERQERLELLELRGRRRILGEREVEERARVRVVVAEALVVEVADRVLVAVGVGEALAVLAHVDGALERVLGRGDEEVVDEPDRAALAVDLVVDAAVGALRPRLVAGLLELRDRGGRRLRVLGGDDRREARLRGLEVRGPDARLLAEPRGEVLLPRQAGVLLGERLVDELAQLRARIVGAQELPGRRQRVLAPVAGRLHRRLEVDRRAGRDERGRIGVAPRGRLAARGGGERQSGAGERER